MIRKTLNQLIKIHNGKDHSHLKSGNIPVYGSGGVMRYVNKKLHDGDCILLPRKGSLTNIMFVQGPFWTVDTMFYATVDTQQVDSKYLYEYLNLLDLSSLNTGSAVPSMTSSVYYSIPISLHPLSAQKQIGKLASSFDKLIDLLEHKLDELEKTAQDFYDYWFIQFDFPDENGNPYRYSGGKMVWNDQLKQEIPEGWQVKSLYEIATFTNGLACQKHRPAENDPGLPVIKIKEMTRGLSSETERVSSNIADKYKIDLGDILFSWSATLLVQRWNATPGGLNQHIFKVEPGTGVGNGYIYLLLKHVVAEFVAIAMSRKTTMGHITQDHLRAKMVAVPPSSVADEFENIYAPLLAQWKTLNRQLMEYRDLKKMLMPLLLNGQANIESPSEQD